MKKLFFFILVFLIGLISFAYADCADLNNSLIYHSFDSNCISDNSGNGYNSINYNSSQVVGKLNNACHFSKSNQEYISLNNSAFSDGKLGNNFTIGLTWKFDSYTTRMTLFEFNELGSPTKHIHADFQTTDNKITVFGGAGEWSKTSVLTYNDLNYHSLIILIDEDGHLNDWFIDGISQGSVNISYDFSIMKSGLIGKLNYTDVGYFYLDGIIDEFGIWNYLFSRNQVLEFNTTCDPYLTATDTIPPTITFLNQTPPDINVFNIQQSDITINYSVTDATGIYSVWLEMFLNNSKITVNGTAFPTTFNISKISPYSWAFDDNEVTSGTFNINESIMESTTHYNTSFSGNNNYLKIEFLNVSSDKNYSLYEYMADNETTATCDIQFYYCNSSYTTGNIVSSSYCALFYQESNGVKYNHTHTINSKHKEIPLTMVNKKVGNIGVSPTSYIVKRFCANPTNIYWINITSRENAVQTSSNNGNTYTSQTYTPDAHIHILDGNESINYRVCAIDNTTARNGGCSAYRGDMIGIVNTNPSSPQFISPITNTYFVSSPIFVLWTPAISQVGLNISFYILEYKNTNSSYTVLVNTTITNYSWSITGFTNGYYQMKVTAYDILGQTSYSESEIFTISTVPSLTETLLIDINSTNSAINNNLLSLKNGFSEGFNMIYWLVLFIFLMYLGLFTTYKFFIAIDGIVAFIMGLTLYYQTTIPDTYSVVYKLVVLALMIAATLGCLVMGVVMELNQRTLNAKQNRQESYYEKRSYKY